MMTVVENCLDQAFLSEGERFGLTKAQCEAIKRACKAWEDFVGSYGKFSQQTREFAKGRKKLSDALKEDLGNLTTDEYKGLFLPGGGSNDIEKRCLFDRALDAKILELETRFGNKNTVIQNYVDDRLYWEDYRAQEAGKLTLN